MAPTINLGDILFVDRGVTTIASDGVYAITMGGQSFIQRVQRGLDGTLHLMCDNSRYPPHQAKPEGVKVAGKVVGVWRWCTL